MIKIPGQIPIFISPIFWLLAFAIGWFSSYSFTETLLWVGVIFVSVLVHEYGHALTAVGFGQRVVIELTGFGGLTVRRNQKPLKPWKEFLIVLNGPLFGFLLCGFSYLLLKVLGSENLHSATAYVLTIAVYINLFWTIINLLPIQPLDGGKLLSVVLEGVFGLRGVKIALFISMILAVVIAILFFIFQSFLAGSLFFIFAMEGYQKWRESWKTREVDQDEVMLRLFQEGQEALQKQEEAIALEKLMQVRKGTQSGMLFKAASELAGVILTHQGKAEEAYEILKPLRKELSPDALLALQSLSYQLGDLKECISLGNRVYHQIPSADVALLNAYAHARLGEVQPALGWLQCAVKEGLPNPSAVLERPEFEPIRSHPLFIKFKKNL